LSEIDGQSPQEVGRRAEDRAERFLCSQGLRTVKRNHRFARGEIDLVMLDGDLLVFVEVRHRGTDRFGSAAESVYTIKQRRLIATAQHYLQTEREHSRRNCRFDVVVVDFNPGATSAIHDGIEWIRDAFQA
jgi:putative endonuclease